MIGVIAEPGDRDVVSEFFELFKTPWEFHRQGQEYDVLLCTGRQIPEDAAKLVVVYAGVKTGFDDQQGIQTNPRPRRTGVLSYLAGRIPVYGDAIVFPDNGNAILTDADSGQCLAYLDRSKEGVVARVGYDLFGEIRVLLTEGQPTSHADLPALELHIAFLRNLITGCGLTLAEIPPVPEGYRFIACLTHDVDHPSIRRHRWDHTTMGFLGRAVLGSFRNWLRGRLSIACLARNWMAAASLPLVHLGLARDFWRDFDDRYLELEQGVPSTFFVIPFADRPGKTRDGAAPGFRAARYGARDIAESMKKLSKAGCEVSLHGIDAWIDRDRGREELAEIRRLTGSPETGVRMHWLYYDRQQSPQKLEEAGASYDSTVGYNETVGYRAGTTQVYKPLTAQTLLELPLHAMDTALFYPTYRDLSPREARDLLHQMIENAVRFGGCLTINWHDRSTAPERLWGACYAELIEELKRRGAWFATAGQAVAWFRKRRSVVFEEAASGAGDLGDGLPGLKLRIHSEGGGSVDRALEVKADARIPCGAGK